MARTPAQRALDAAVARREPKVARALAAGLVKAGRDVSTAELAALIERGDIDGAAALMAASTEKAMEPSGKLLEEAFTEGADLGEEEVRKLEDL